ncbi:phosphoribosyltransferase [Sinorhizobium sp. BG8]|uniref:phosphoribosyltransferase n=1 Tax=Sinorhizobium sp. BG8 TaxID=2613773 RepID=UPI00193D4322|nr:phosphoribosyltransferase [Sinorhizobium sp. BG8]QRM56448.1 phosphoribosyltransferase [Sinorhizobium sp. BG8]
MLDVFFEDREDAGAQLAAKIAVEEPAKPVVLALPRGGVPVAYEICKRFRAPLDVLLVRKIGAPANPEVALGAIVDGAQPQIVLNDDIMAACGVTPRYIDVEARRQLAEIDRRRRMYVGNRMPLPLAGRNVILVDDGIATGATVKVALKALRRLGCGSVLLAIPVAPLEVISELRADVDRIVCLHMPADFRAVGLHYRDFHQTSDEEVIEILALARGSADETPA